MHLEVLVEEPSAKEFLEIVLGRMLSGLGTFNIHQFGGKQNLLSKLGARLRGYSHWMTEDMWIVVLVDRDQDACHVLKENMEVIVQDAGLVSRTMNSTPGAFQVVNRIVIEELEAWYFGDVLALTAAYPGVSATLGQQARYRDPDSIRGGTWEALQRVLQRAGHHKAGLQKIRAAREVAKYFDPSRNTSRSFSVFREAIKEISAIGTR